MSIDICNENIEIVTYSIVTENRHVRMPDDPEYSAELVEALFASPVVTPVNLGKRLAGNYRTASRYLAELVIGKELGEKMVGKYHFFFNKKLLDLLKS